MSYKWQTSIDWLQLIKVCLHHRPPTHPTCHRKPDLVLDFPISRDRQWSPILITIIIMPAHIYCLFYLSPTRYTFQAQAKRLRDSQRPNQIHQKINN